MCRVFAPRDEYSIHEVSWDEGGFIVLWLIEFVQKYAVMLQKKCWVVTIGDIRNGATIGKTQTPILIQLPLIATGWLHGGVAPVGGFAPTGVAQPEEVLEP